MCEMSIMATGTLGSAELKEPITMVEPYGPTPLF